MKEALVCSVLELSLAFPKKTAAVAEFCDFSSPAGLMLKGDVPARRCGGIKTGGLFVNWECPFWAWGCTGATGQEQHRPGKSLTGSQESTTSLGCLLFSGVGDVSFAMALLCMVVL